MQCPNAPLALSIDTEVSVEGANLCATHVVPEVDTGLLGSAGNDKRPQFGFVACVTRS